ncbi:MAG: T9SS type A sorting domain-containing protein, partial [Mucilaginibacter sp.]
RGFNLVGNPYASSIDWDTYATSGTTGIVAGGTPISKSMYILDPVSKNYSIYVAGTASKAGTIVLNNANIIPSGQGFFVIASDATSTLTFNESAKTNGQASAATGNLLLSTQPLAVKVDQYLHLMLKKDTLNVDGLLINFNDNAKSKFDISKDAPYKIGSGIASLSSRSADSVALSINTLSLPKQGQTVIGLNISAKTDGIYQLNMQSIKSLPAVYEVWLMDAYKKDSLDVRQNPTYSFNITNSDAASFGAKRFSLVIRQNAGLGVKLVNFTATKSSNGVQTIWTTKNEQNYTNFTIERSNDNGKTFEVVGGTGSSAVGTYSLVDKEPLAPADQYRLKIEDLNGNITYSDIVTIQYSNLSNNIVKNGVSIYPNPATSTIKLSITKTTSNVALYGIEIVNNRGAVIKTAVSTQPDWQSDVTGLMPGSYIIRVINNTDRSLIARGTFIKL